LESRQAKLGPIVVSFYPLLNGGFSPASYRRHDLAPDLQRDWSLIEDALFSIAKAVSIAGPEWSRTSGNSIFPFAKTVDVPSASARQVLDNGARSFRDALDKSEDLSEVERAAFSAGAQEIAVAVDGMLPEHTTTGRFLDLLMTANPCFRPDWPVWLDTRSFQDPRFFPKVTNNAWQALVVYTAGNVPWDLAEFYRLDPKGKFYLRRTIDDDSFARVNKFPVGGFLDPHHVIARTAEAIAVSLSFAYAMGCDPAKTRLAFHFRWSKLAGRVIHSWTGVGRFIPPHERYKSADDDAEGMVEIELSTPVGALGQFVERATADLFGQFGGFEVPVGFAGSVVKKLVEKG
jgi:hypothetical protein